MRNTLPLYVRYCFSVYQSVEVVRSHFVPYMMVFTNTINFNIPTYRVMVDTGRIVKSRQLMFSGTGDLQYRKSAAAVNVVQCHCSFILHRIGYAVTHCFIANVVFCHMNGSVVSEYQGVGVTKGHGVTNCVTVVIISNTCTVRHAR